MTAPHLLALSAYQAPVGTLLEVYGTDFLEAASAESMLVFRGTYTTDTGAQYAVDHEFPAVRLDAGTLRWDTFGPFRVPFGASGNEVGIFNGHVFARAIAEDVVLDDPEPTPVSFQVTPSILVTELQPITATCGAPVSRAIGGVPYRLGIETIGFDPVSVTYTVAAPAVPSAPVIAIRHEMSGRYDTVGTRGDLVLPYVPEDKISYGAIFTIAAMAADGSEYRTSFAIDVHRPLELFYDGNVEIAELLPPVPVSGCIPGGEAGRTVDYIEQVSETRRRSYNINWNQSWLTSHTTSSGSSNTNTATNTNGFNITTTDGTNWKWSVSGYTEAGGSAGVPLVAEGEVKVGVSAGRDWGGLRNEARGNSNVESHTESTVTTDTEAETEAEGNSEGGAFAWEVSSEELVRQEFGGIVIAGTQGVFYRQTLRLVRRGVVVTYNQCGASDVVAEADFTDWTWATDLALATSCPPLPPSNLPPAECLASPCVGE